MIDNRNVKIYGNVFYREQGWNPKTEEGDTGYVPDDWIGNHGLIGGWTGAPYSDVLVYNNTFINVNQSAPRPLAGAGSINGFVPARNNLFYNSAYGGTVGWGGVSEHNYNHFADSGGLNGEANGSQSSGNPFVTLNVSSVDFAKLATSTVAGDSTVPVEYRTDWWGNVGISRGAVQSGASQTDVTAPTVSITSPAAGVVVSNTITLNATANDNAGGSGVAGVSFLLDGLVIGVDTASPYSLSWDSRTVVNGSHSIQAQAVDGAGNQKTSGAVFVTVQNSALTLNDGLIGYWTFNETGGTMAGDASGNANTGTLLNGVTHLAGPMGSAVGFDGIDDYVRVANAASLEPVSAVSLSVWVNLQSNGQWQSLVSKVLQEGSHAYPFSAYELFVELVDGAYRARLGVSGTDGNRLYALGTTALNYGTWYQLVGTYDGSAAKIYVNGVLEGSTSYSSTLLQTGEPLLIGRTGNGGDALNGRSDDLRIFDRVLADKDILDLFSGNVAPQPPSNFRLVVN